MKLIGLQAGHQNITHNVDKVLATETGAPGEAAFNVAIRDLLGQYLIAYGFAVQLDDANANSNTNTIGKDFAFYLAIHAEAAPAGGAISAPDPSVDVVNAESRRIVTCIEDVYFADTGIVNTPAIITSNMTYYYMWNVLTAQTPCGIIECGDLIDPHDTVILADTRRVALGICHGICQAFGIAWKGDPTTASAPVIPPTTSANPVVSPSTPTPPLPGSTIPPIVQPQQPKPPIIVQPPATPAKKTNSWRKFIGRLIAFLNSL